MFACLWSVMIAVTLATAGHAQDARAQFNAIKAQEAQDAGAAFAAMAALARSGYVPAAHRLGTYHRHGVGTQTDLLAARHWYGRAASAGHPWSFAALARTDLALGRSEAALQLLRTAARDQRPGAARLLGAAHIDGAFGAASDPALGHRMLAALAGQGDARAARDLLSRYTWNRVQGQAPRTIVDTVVAAGLAGDPRFAETALVYLTRLPDTRARTTELRAALITVPGMRRRTVLIARLHLAADQEPARFWTRAEQVLQDTEPAHYADVARTAFRLNKNAWVRVLQRALREFGYYSGPVTATMTTRTIRAQNRFCRDRGLWGICAAGPLRGQTVHAVAGALAAARHGE